MTGPTSIACRFSPQTWNRHYERPVEQPVNPPGKKVSKWIIGLFAACTLLATSAALANVAAVEAILTKKNPPPGVVFEIVEGDANALSWAVPQITSYTKRLRERFPKLEIAVVTHGREMFALQTAQRGKNLAVHQAVESLTMDDKVPVHVCETYAGWRGIGAEAFPEYVDVAPAGPAQINNYRALGFVLIKVSRQPEQTK